MDPRTLALEALIKKLSYREGDFTLASGKKSKFYVDLKSTTLHPDGAALIGELTVEKLSRTGYPIEGVGGLTLGADPIATAVSLAARQKGLNWPAYIVRKEIKGHGAMKYIEGAGNLMPGARLAVVEDVATTGGSSIQAIERLRAAGFHPTVVLSVVDRASGAAEAFAAAGVKYLYLTTLERVQGAK